MLGIRPPSLDVASNEIVNFLIEFGKQSYYVLYRIKEGSTSREVITKVPVEKPSYMHSFAMTQHYLILAEFPLIVNPLDLLIKNQPFIHNFAWEPQKGTRFLVIERDSGAIVSKFVANPFSSFHHANAYEIENGSKIIVDLVAYPDISTMPSIFPQASSISIKHDWQKRLMRYHLNLSTNEIFPEVLLEMNVEFPRIDDKLDGKNYRYLYLTNSENSETTTGLIKLDMLTKEIKTWHQTNCKALEPIFISSPNAQNEDDGVILSVVYDEEKQRSFLLALDGQAFQEIAQAELPWHIPGSFHGQYFNESIFIQENN